jgi:PTH2 family peptidyl-tRNA hydrolase
MSSGKLCSQAGHAFVDTYEQCRIRDPVRAETYLEARHGTKVVLAVPNEEMLRAIQSQVLSTGLPCALIEDSGHVMPPHFDGSPVVTALGIGPALRNEIHPITKRLALVP